MTSSVSRYKPWSRMSRREQEEALERLRGVTTPEVSEGSAGVAPRCPLCGIVLDLDILAAAGSSTRAYFRFAPISAHHLTQAHSMKITPEENQK